VQEVSSKHGEARWFPAFKHKVENLGDTAYDGVYIGVKENSSTTVGTVTNKSLGLGGEMMD